MGNGIDFGSGSENGSGGGGGYTGADGKACGDFIGHPVNPNDPEICIVFSNPLNDSIQVGDRIYYALPSTGQAGVNHPSNPVLTKPVYLGVATYVMYWDEPTQESLICIEDPAVSTVSSLDCDEGETHGEGMCCDVYYFFSKDNEVNLTSLVGYYAQVQVRNNSLLEAEMFSITSDFASSSR